MKTLGRVLGILGLLVLVWAIVASLMARQYRRAYLNEKQARVAEASATADLFLSSAQESLLKAGLAVNRSNFEEAKAEIGKVKKSLEVFSNRPLPKDLKGNTDLSAALVEIESDLIAVKPEVQKKILSLANIITDLRNKLGK